MASKRSSKSNNSSLNAGSRPGGRRGSRSQSGGGDSRRASVSGRRRGAKNDRRAATSERSNTPPGSGGNARKRGNTPLKAEQVEGRQAVRELLLAGRRSVRSISILESSADSQPLVDLMELARDLGVVVELVSRSRFDSIAETWAPQGVVASAAPLDFDDLDELATHDDAFLVLLDGVTDPRNVGAVARSAECTGVTGVVLPKHRAAGLNPAAVKTAAGAVEYLNFAQVGGIAAAVKSLNERGVTTIGLDMAGDVPITKLPPLDGPVAVVLGAEGSGLSQLVRRRTQILSAIPMWGNLNSLNVAQAASIACFEIARRRRRS